MDGHILGLTEVTKGPLNIYWDEVVAMTPHHIFIDGHMIRTCVVDVDYAG